MHHRMAEFQEYLEEHMHQSMIHEGHHIYKHICSPYTSEDRSMHLTEDMHLSSRCA